MDLTTTYLGLKLKNPLVISACPMAKDLYLAKELEQQGAAALVMPSLFEEEITYDQVALDHFLGMTTNAFAEAADFFPEPPRFENLHAEEYLETLAKIKQSVKIPVIASLNGITVGGWAKYAKKMEQAGANALELNIFYVPTDLNMEGTAVEQRYLEVLKAVKAEVKIPVAVKIGSFFSSIPNMCKKLVGAGADGLVLFNRFLEPDFNLDTLDVAPKIEFSHAYEMRTSLHWTAILSSQLKCSLGATRGIKDASHLIKYLLAGAHVGMITSVLYQHGIDSVGKILADMEKWMAEKEYTSVEQMRGSMNYRNVPDPSTFERANYMKMLRSII